jgi:hypothetical protein
MELHMHRDTISFLAAVAWLAASGLGCSEASGPTDANLAQMATKRGPTLTPQTSGTTARLIGVHAVNQNVAWVSGVDGTFAVTTDGGATWNAGVVPGAEERFRRSESRQAESEGRPRAEVVEPLRTRLLPRTRPGRTSSRPR